MTSVREWLRFGGQESFGNGGMDITTMAMVGTATRTA